MEWLVNPGQTIIYGNINNINKSMDILLNKAYLDIRKMSIP
jgi:hypothetical protein